MTHSPPATTFAAIASRYLDLITAPGLDGRDRRDVMRELIPLLGELLTGLLALPVVSDAELEGDLPRPRVSHGPFRPAIQRCLGDWDRYREVFDPCAAEGDDAGETVGASLSDDLGDVAHDLAAGLADLEDGRPRRAIWHWRFAGAAHWGAHAADALRAITWRLLAEMRGEP